MNIKSHYKIIISIVIIIILVSSVIIYYNINNKNNTSYYNNGKSIDVKYFNVGYTFPYNKNNYSLSSYSINNNKTSYLNSTIINPRVLPYNSLGIYFGINIVNNLKNKYIYITITGNDNKYFSGINNYSSEKIKNNNIIYKINNSNKVHYSIYSLYLGNYLNNNYYNFTIKISSGKLYNTFYINTLKESAIYGTVGLKPGCSDNNNGYDTSLNSIMFVYNVNESKYNIVNITNGNYYFFTVPGDSYKMYYLNNNNLTLFKYNDGKNITLINTPLKIESIQYNIYE